MGASDFRSPPPSSSLFRLVGRCALLPAPRIGSPWLPRVLVVRLDADSDPGVAPRACQCARDAVVCWPIETIDQFTHLTISGLMHLQGQHHLFPLRLASFCAYASSFPLPECLQGSIPGPWLAVTWAGFTPARPRGIAKPQPMAGLHVPLPTLRRHPRGCLRTAWGRCGSLFLHRRDLHHLLLAGLPAHLCKNTATRRVHKCWALRLRYTRFFRNTEGSHDPAI
jgi:hypothetical protein